MNNFAVCSAGVAPQTPPTNRGSERAGLAETRVAVPTSPVGLVDTVTCTFRAEGVSQEAMLERVKDLLTPFSENDGDYLDCNARFTGPTALEGLPGGGWEATPRGRNGYTRGLMRGYVSIWYGGTAEMGVNVHITGQGCRQLEAEGLIDSDPESPFTWPCFLDACRAAGGRFSRLDMALDDFAGLLDLSVIRSHFVNRHYVSRIEEKNYHESVKNVKGYGEVVGRTCQLGGAKSPSLFRMYDKRAERIVAGACPDDLPEHWVRAELQARDDRADNLAGWVIRSGVAGVAAVLRALVSFRVPSATDSDRRRWPVAEWWSAFLGECEKAPSLATKPEVKPLASKLDHFKHQYAGTLAAAVRATGYGLEWIAEVIAEGEVKLRQSAAKWRNSLASHEQAMFLAGQAGTQHSADVIRPHLWCYDTGDSRATWAKILGVKSQSAALRRLNVPDLLEILPARIVADGVAKYVQGHGLSMQASSVF